jgi:hypothetical protein
MSNHIYRSIQEPIREEMLSFEERWKGSDMGLITCWETGRKMAINDPELVSRILSGELPAGLGWKGGVDENTKQKKKIGTLYYLAQMQGLRGDDLDIDWTKEYVLVCSKTGVKVTYTSNVMTYGNAK